MHSARALLSGGDLRYGVPALTGSTSLPHVLMLSGLLSAGASDLLALRLSMMLGLFAYLGGVIALARALSLAPVQTALLAGLALVAGDAVLQASNGLETGFAIGLVLGAIAATIARRAAVAAVLTGLLPWVRADLALIAAAIWLSGLLLSPQDWRRAVWIPLAIAVPFAGLFWANTGSLIPNTIGAKRLFFADGCAAWPTRWALFSNGLRDWGTLVAPVLIGLVAGALFSPLARAGLAAAAATLVLYLIALPGAVSHNDHRYLYPILLPWLLLGMALLLPRMRWQLWTAAVAVLAFVFVPAQRLKAQQWATAATELQAMAEWVATSVPADAAVAVHDAGAISIRGTQPLIDLVGLKSPASVAVHETLTWPSCGSRRVDAFAEILRSRQPGYLVVHSEWESLFNVTGAVPLAHATLHTARLGGPGYSVYQLSW